MNAAELLGSARGLARSTWKAVVAWGPRMSNPITSILVAVMIVGGVVLRIRNVGHPFHHGFDEEQYTDAAQKILLGMKDMECCHPPGSKLLFGVGILLAGNNPMGWRYTPLVFGLQAIVVVFLMANSLFEDRRAGWLAAAFMAADGFFLAYSRAGLGDMILACLVLWSMLAAVTARGWPGVLTCAVLIGAAASIKWVGLFIGLPAVMAILLLRRAPWYTIVSFAIVPFVHYVVWVIGLQTMGLPSDLMTVIAEVRKRANTHLGFTHFSNPLESAWYTWLVMYHPLIIKSAQVGTKVRLASSVGNPLLWFSAEACLAAFPVLGGAVALRARWRERWERWFDVRATKALAILAASWLSMLLLWMSGKISTYWYHYLYAWGFALTFLAGVVALLDRRYPKAALIFVLLVLAISVFFVPVWAEMSVSVRAAHWRLPFPLWQ
jgi:dolichyl-phosphate-mannose--protein O-mannosyl transferase